MKMDIILYYTYEECFARRMNCLSHAGACDMFAMFPKAIEAFVNQCQTVFEFRKRIKVPALCCEPGGEMIYSNLGCTEIQRVFSPTLFSQAQEQIAWQQLAE